MKLKIVMIAFVAILIYSCGAKSTVSADEAQKAALIAKQNQGKIIYEENCAKCHGLPDPKSYTNENWMPILKKMQPKAHLQDADIDKIYAYILSK